MPPKSLFDNSHRPNKLVMPACDQCNRDTSTADLTASIVSRWNYFTNSQEVHDYRRLIERLRKQDPDLVKEQEISDPFERERARQHLRNYGMPVPHDAGVATIGPHTIRQLNLFAHKAVLALHFEHIRQPLPITGRISAYWKTKEDFAHGGISPSLLAIMPEYGSLIQGKWNERETFEYRHAKNVEYGLFACFAKLRRGLFVTGFTVTDANVIVPDDNVEWMRPHDPLVLLEDPRFWKKL
jgi:hypothetical protein